MENGTIVPETFGDARKKLGCATNITNWSFEFRRLVRLATNHEFVANRRRRKMDKTALNG
jgi:hypothetical protein